MTQLFELTDHKKYKPWLEEGYQAKKNRTLSLGKEAIDKLMEAGKRVSYRNIEAMSKEIDPEKKGIHANSVKFNEELYQYYLKFANLKKTTKTPSRILEKPFSYQHLKENRDLNDVKRRYLQLSRSELVARLIQAEEYIAKRQHDWKKSIFEQFK